MRSCCIRRSRESPSVIARNEGAEASGLMSGNNAMIVDRSADLDMALRANEANRKVFEANRERIEDLAVGFVGK
eukprot:gene18427-22553_t